jgi:nitric oxide reductase subunit B
MQTLRWMRVPGDTIFAVGELTMVWFVFSLRRRREPAIVAVPQPAMGD